MHDSTSPKSLEEAECGVPGAGGGRWGASVGWGWSSSWDDEKVLEKDGGDGRAARCM